MTGVPRPVRAYSWVWHYPDGTDRLCLMLNNRNARLVIPTDQLREIADLLHDRADEAEIHERRTPR